MLLFDADVHISPRPASPAHMSAEAAVECMARAQVERALCWLSPHGIRDVSESNRYIYRSAKRYPQLIPFGWANPMEGVDKALEDARTCLMEFGFPGVKLNGAQNGYPIDSRDALRVAGEVARLGGMLAYHIGADSPDNTHPYRLREVAERFSDTPILAVHMGGAGKPELADAAIAVAQRCPNILLIASAVSSRAVRRAIETLGAQRVLFGSDTPFEPMEVEVARMRAIVAPYTQKEQAAVLGGAAQRLFHG